MCPPRAGERMFQGLGSDKKYALMRYLEFKVVQSAVDPRPESRGIPEVPRLMSRAYRSSRVC
jgi:hypothetical protein